MFLTHDGNYCHHEGFDGCKSIAEYRNKIGNDGDSGTALMMLGELDGPTLIIERDLEPALSFCEEHYQYDMYEYLLKLKNQMDKLDGLRVPFDQIDYRLEEIWEWLIGTPYDRAWGEKMKKLNIQVAAPLDMKVEDSLIRELQAI